MKPVRGEVYWLDLREHADMGHWEERPAIVVSSDFFNKRLDTVVVVTLTAQDARKDDHGCVFIARSAVKGVPGLDHDSVAVCHSPITAYVTDLGERLGALEPRALSDVESVLSFALDLGPYVEPDDA